MIGEYYAWVEVEPDGKEGVIVTGLLMVGDVLAPLQHRERQIVEKIMRPLAEGHRKASGKPVRLVRYERAETLEELP